MSFAADPVGLVRLRVSSLDRSIPYYRDILGLHIDRTAGVARAGTAGRALLELVETPDASPVPHGGRPGLYHFALLLRDRAALGAFARHLRTRRVQFGASDHLFSEALYLTDPDGITIEVYADRPRSEWQYREGEIVGTTAPLDLTQLERSAHAAWEGIPEDTVMGHLHFHVGDLAAAEAWYVRGLGFDPVIRSFPGALFVSAHGYHHHVGLNTWAAGRRPAQPSDAGLIDWELRLVDTEAVGAVADALERAGHAVSMSGDVASAHDPWGITVRVRSDAP